MVYRADEIVRWAPESMVYRADGVLGRLQREDEVEAGHRGRRSANRTLVDTSRHLVDTYHAFADT